jgi:inhibitor of the pro-sigma K processing machinery
MDYLITIVLAAVGIGLIILLVKLFSTPLRWVLKLLLNAAMGFVSLFIINFLGGFVGISLGVNLINAIVVGVLGFPGVVLLLLLKYLL